MGGHLGHPPASGQAWVAPGVGSHLVHPHTPQALHLASGGGRLKATSPILAQALSEPTLRLLPLSRAVSKPQAGASWAGPGLPSQPGAALVLVPAQIFFSSLDQRGGAGRRYWEAGSFEDQGFPAVCELSWGCSQARSNTSGPSWRHTELLGPSTRPFTFQ